MQDASVVGRTAWLGAVGAITEPLGLGARRAAARARAQAAGAPRAPPSVEGEIEFSFAHALTQEVAYGQIRRVDRAEKHERAAAWIERWPASATTRPSCSPTTTWPRSSSASRPARMCGALEPKLRTALAEAGRQAQAVNAYATAARHLAAALELTPRPTDPARPRPPARSRQTLRLSRRRLPTPRPCGPRWTRRSRRRDWSPAAAAACRPRPLARTARAGLAEPRRTR